MRLNEIARPTPPNPDPFQPLLDAGMKERNMPRQMATSRRFVHGHKSYVFTHIDYAHRSCWLKDVIGKAKRGTIDGLVAGIERRERNRQKMAFYSLHAHRQPAVMDLIKGLTSLGFGVTTTGWDGSMLIAKINKKVENMDMELRVFVTVSAQQNYTTRYEIAFRWSEEGWTAHQGKYKQERFVTRNEDLDMLCAKTLQRVRKWVSDPSSLFTILQDLKPTKRHNTIRSIS